MRFKNVHKWQQFGVSNFPELVCVFFPELWGSWKKRKRRNVRSWKRLSSENSNSKNLSSRKRRKLCSCRYTFSPQPISVWFFFHDHFEIRILFFFGPQEEAKNFITLENLDQRIEEALDNPKNYNFAVDKVGRVVKQTVLQWQFWGQTIELIVEHQTRWTLPAIWGWPREKSSSTIVSWRLSFMVHVLIVIFNVMPINPCTRNWIVCITLVRCVLNS